MFTGIIENLGKIKSIVNEGENKHITVLCDFVSELEIDQSVAHNGVCLTIVKLFEDSYTVTAIKETLNKTNLKNCKEGDVLNLERAMILGARLDGHIVQGHVDQTAICTHIKEESGSWLFTFTYDAQKGNVTIEKGSITVNGVSLTVVNSLKDSFSVAIIPYTYKYTNFHTFSVGTKVNLEFDVLGKYVAKLIHNS